MKKQTRKRLTIALVAVFLFSMTMLMRQLIDKSSGGSSYTQALEIATARKPVTELPPVQEETVQPEKAWVVAPVEEEDPHIRELEEIDLQALREVNPDVVGWIMIPDTKINYPLMKGSDNDYYLKHTWDGKKNIVGSIFLEHLCSADLADFNTVVYGHNMNNGSMFAGIRRYRFDSYWKEHPYVYILSDMGVYRYEVFSTYQAPVDSGTYRLSFPDEMTRERFLHNATADSVVAMDVEPEITDRILTLSTCSGAGYSTRWVVHARLKMIQEQVS